MELYFNFFFYDLCYDIHGLHKSLGTCGRALKGGDGGSYSQFPPQILTKSHRPTAQIPSSLCLSCSNINPIPIFYCFFVDESQSQCMTSHFPAKKRGNPNSHFTPLGPSCRAVGQKIFMFWDSVLNTMCRCEDFL